ncbi:MAG TPA: formate--tetrahydrofolate ligase, partial [Bacteroidales bacterium]|nr:formate--tetrahydrofolate ligase [Bacteroidales bacterium]
MKSDIEIAKAANMLPIRAIAANLNIDQDLVEKFGRYKAKLPLNLIDEEKVKKSKLIL